MHAKEARAKAKSNYLNVVKVKIEQAVANGQLSCSLPVMYLTEECEDYLTANEYQYKTYVNRGGWFTETEVRISWN